MSVTFTLNGTTRTVEAAVGENLQALLQRIGIHSVRNSDDGEGFAGSDTILLDGRPVLAGLMVAGQVEGRSIETVESLMRDGRLSVIQESMLDAGVVQSAYNSPAAALLIADLLRRIDSPSEDDVRDALSGLFSRATGYRQFFPAVKLARERLRAAAAAGTGAGGGADAGGGSEAASPPAGTRFVGKDHRRVDGVKLAAGMKAFVEDLVEPGSCVLKLLRSPHAHARIASIDTAAAEKLPGVVAVITHANCPDVRYGCAGQGAPEPSPYDRRMFDTLLRHHGDRVAAVVAESAEIADAALALIKVEYEVLDPVLGLEEAMAERGPRVHPEPIEYPLPIGADARRNLAASASGSVGDVEQGVPRRRRRRRAHLHHEPGAVHAARAARRVHPHGRRPAGHPRLDPGALAPAPHRRPGARHRREPGARHQGAHRRRLRQQAGHPARGGVRLRHPRRRAGRCSTSTRARRSSSPPPCATRSGSR